MYVDKDRGKKFFVNVLELYGYWFAVIKSLVNIVNNNFVKMVRCTHMWVVIAHDIQPAGKIALLFLQTCGDATELCIGKHSAF